MKMFVLAVGSLAALALSSTACSRNDSKSSGTSADGRDPFERAIIFADSASPSFERSSGEQLESANYESEAQKNALKKFVTGREFCAKFAATIAAEKGRFVKVPVSYSDASRGYTEVFAFFAEGFFDPKLPTMAFFDGGPGGNSHGMTRLTESFNELHFDHRGVGCSHPAELSLYRDPSFYSSENNAKDLEEIRKAFGIEKLSVIGSSYGTIPATIYASLFPERTTALVLEGVMYSGNSVENSRVIQYRLKRMYATFPQETKAAMRSYFSDLSKATGVFQLTRLAMYSSGAFDRLTKLLTTVFASPEKIDREKADRLFDPKFFSQVFFEGDRVDAVEAFNNKILQCKEFPSLSRTLTLFIWNDLLQLEMFPYKASNQDDKSCAEIGVSAVERAYEGSQYPVRVPVTYFQGNWDGATFAPGAVTHYKKVPSGKKQIFIAVKGGHSPNIEMLRERGLARTMQLLVFEKALKGELAGAGDVNSLNSTQQTVVWKHTSK